MNSNWSREIRAVLRKEAQSELRTKNGLVTAGLFGLCSIITIAVATFNARITGDLAAGLIWVAILFASVIAIPRTFLVEEEQGTADLLRLFARPHAVYWGKALFNAAQTCVLSTLIVALFVLFTNSAVGVPGILVITILGGSFAMAGAVTLAGALVARANNRAVIAGAISVPLLLPVLGMGVGAMRVVFAGQMLGADPNEFLTGFVNSGWMSAVGLSCYAVATMAIGPWIYAAVWKS